MTELALTALLSWSLGLTLYATPGEPPRMVYLSEREFVTAVCEGKTPCSALGSYRDSSRTIFLRKSLRDRADVRARSVIVHELVHYLQDLSGRWTTKSCANWVEREREAYRVQAAYLRGQKVPAPIGPAAFPDDLCSRA